MGQSVVIQTLCIAYVRGGFAAHCQGSRAVPPGRYSGALSGPCLRPIGVAIRPGRRVCSDPPLGAARRAALHRSDGRAGLNGWDGLGRLTF